MANKIETLDASAAIKSPAEKFYNFFKYNLKGLVEIYPTAFTGVKLLQGEEGTMGCLEHWNYVLGGVPMTAKLLTEAIDDSGKSIIFSIVEGDVMQLYNSFKANLTVSDGLANCSIEYEKATLITPPPEPYVPLVVTVLTLVDAYLLAN